MSLLPTYTHLPLHDNELEKAVLGTLLCDAHGLRTGLTLLREATVFYQLAHQAIFQAIQALVADNKAVDHLSVVRQLSSDGQLTRAGGAPQVISLLGRAQSAAKLDTHCKFLLELYTKRRIGEVARTLLSGATDPTQDCFVLLGQAHQELNNLHNGLQLKRPRQLAEVYDGVVDGIVQASELPDGLTGVPSGIASLDRVTGGWQKSDLIIIAARPSMGKTSLAAFMARMAAGDQRYPGVIFSLEMSTEQLVRKMIATEAGYTTAQLQRGRLPGGKEEAEYIRERARALRKVGLLFDDTTGLSTGEFRAKVAKLVAEYGIQFVVVDYLQLMSHPDARGNREQEISSISRTLKMTAKEHNIPVIALAQLSREVEKRGGEKKPMLSDLRESGAIEQDADVIVFPYRPEYYKIMEDELGRPTANTTEIIIAKHRNGSLANVVVSSNMAQGRYTDLDSMPSLATPIPGEHFGPRVLGAESLRTTAPSDFDDYQDE